MLNQTDLIRHIKAKIGAAYFSPEFSDSEIMQIVSAETLPEFSAWIPRLIRSHMVTPLDRDVNDRSRFVVNIPNERIIGVRMAEDDHRSRVAGAMGTGYDAVIPRNPMDVIHRQLTQDLISAGRTPVTCTFEPPCYCRITPIMHNQAVMFLDVKVVHPDNLSTIHMNYRNVLYSLALADVSDEILALRQSGTIGTTFGEIELDVNRLQAFADKRQEIQEVLKKASLRSVNTRKVRFS